MAGPTVHGTSSTSGGANISVTTPTYSSGDLMLAVALTQYNGTFTPPSGWTTYEAHNNAVNDYVKMCVAYKTATGSEPGSYSFTNNDYICIVVASISGGAAPEAISSITDSSYGASSVTADGVATLGANRLIVATWGAMLTNSATWSLPGGVTLLGSQESKSIAKLGVLQLAASTFAAATEGTTSNETATISNNANATAFQFAIPSSSVAYTLTASYGSFSETGRAAAAGYGLTAAYGSFAETGKAAAASYTVPLGFGSFALSGFPDDEIIGGPAECGSFSLSGFGATFSLVHLLDLADAIIEYFASGTDARIAALQALLPPGNMLADYDWSARPAPYVIVSIPPGSYQTEAEGTNYSYRVERYTVQFEIITADRPTGIAIMDTLESALLHKLDLPTVLPQVGRPFRMDRGITLDAANPEHWRAVLNLDYMLQKSPL